MYWIFSEIGSITERMGHFARLVGFWHRTFITATSYRRAPLRERKEMRIAAKGPAYLWRSREATISVRKVVPTRRDEDSTSSK